MTHFNSFKFTFLPLDFDNGFIFLIMINYSNKNGTKILELKNNENLKNCLTELFFTSFIYFKNVQFLYYQNLVLIFLLSYHDYKNNQVKLKLCGSRVHCFLIISDYRIKIVKKLSLQVLSFEQKLHKNYQLHISTTLK